MRREVVLTIWDYGALDDGAEQVPTLEKCKPSNQTETCGIPCKVCLDLS